MGRNERAEDEKPGAASGVHHNGDLYDEDVEDEATGKKFDNDERPADEDLTVIDNPDDEDDEDANSLGARWLKENDK